MSSEVKRPDVELLQVMQWHPSILPLCAYILHLEAALKRYADEENWIVIDNGDPDSMGADHWIDPQTVNGYDLAKRALGEVDGE